MNNKKGKFIVIDGTDGSGKGTQTKLITDRLIANGFDVKIADFPQYGKKSAGLVEEYLNGKYGDPRDVGPYRGSIFYAMDRYDASFQIKEWLNQGRVVICNRYVTSNMGHQGGKISNPLERKAYFNWLYSLEFELFKIPKPDLNIILHVDAKIAQKLVGQKESRNYILNGQTKDIHEKDITHLRDAEKVYLEIAHTFPNFKLIECIENNQLLSKREINNLLWNELMKILNNNNQNSIKTLEVERLSPSAKLPTRAYKHDAGYDIYSDDYYSLLPGDRINIKTNLKIKIPESHVGLIRDKSGIANNGIYCMAGIIDPGYRGEWLVNIINLSQDTYNIQPGQKIAQILIQKVEHPKIIETKINEKTERGNGGFGSSGLF
jgi:dTMP kinase